MYSRGVEEKDRVSKEAKTPSFFSPSPTLFFSFGVKRATQKRNRKTKVREAETTCLRSSLYMLYPLCKGLASPSS